MSYTLAADSWGEDEARAIIDTLSSRRYTMGPRVRQFEDEFAKYVGSRNAVMTNSGSSANLVALSAVFHRYALDMFDEVIVPAVSWSTTYFPIHQLGLKMVFVDVDDTFNMDPTALQEAITPRTRAVMMVNLLGNAANLSLVREVCDERGLLLIEDNCESLGALSDTGRQAGTVGDCGTFSFFFSHHMQTMEGGMVVTDDDILADYMRSVRAHGWVRDLRTNALYEKSGDDFEDSFKFVLPGYCVRPLEMSAAVGSVQLRRLDEFLKNRRDNAAYFLRVLSECGGRLTPQACDPGRSSWFGFGVILPEGVDRREVVKSLRYHGVETRPIVSGNFVNQPVMHMIDHRVHGRLTVAEAIDKRGLFIGNDHRDLRSDISRAVRVMGGFNA